jgi:dipeptidyl aminopeptidase/acylaminoacyl peptidase
MQMKRKLVAQDLYAIRSVADPNISPDGNRLAYVVTQANAEHNRNIATIKLISVTGDHEPIELSADGAEVRSPRWSPSSSQLAFISDETGKPQVYTYTLDSGDRRQLPESDTAISDLCWTADGNSLILCSQIPQRSSEEDISDTVVIRSLAYKFNGEGLIAGRRSVLFHFALDSEEVRRLTPDDFDASQPAVSPDGQWLAYTAGRFTDRESHQASDVFVLDLSTGQHSPVSAGDGSYANPSWSPDGTMLAYTGHPIRPDGPFPLQDQLYVWDDRSGSTRELMANDDRAPGGGASSDIVHNTPIQVPQWSTSGERIYTLVADRGSISIGEVHVADHTYRAAHTAGEIQSFAVAADGSIYLTQSGLDEPPEVFRFQPGSKPQRLTDENQEIVDQVTFGSLGEIWSQSDPGVEVHSLIILPPDFTTDRSWPAIISVHGGPHAMYSAGFHFGLHVLASAGYIVLMPNPRASTGYGQDWLSGLENDWGGADYRDVMSALEKLVDSYPVDRDQLGIIGESYGGYMTNWAISQGKDFAAAVTQNSSCNRYSLYGSSDMVMMFSDREFGGSPYEKPENYLKRSPISYVANVSTPTLILHCENDMRVPISQGEEWFVALKKHGVEVEFVRFPGEHHMITRLGTPRHRVERIQRTQDWFDEHLSGRDR